MKIWVSFVFVLQFTFLLSVIAVPPDPYPYLNGGAFIGIPVPQSPDPLVTYRWGPSVEPQLQNYYITPVAVTSDSYASFTNLNNLTKLNSPVKVSGTGSIIFDFGQENAGWFEFQSDDLNLAFNLVRMSISEYKAPAIVNLGPASPIKTNTPRQYSNFFRLELNSQLYEGVRYAWIHIDYVGKPFSIYNPRVVSQILPTNYEASFLSSDDLLTRIWWTAAYTVKLNLMPNYFAAILMDRGDRISWCGDAHIAQGVALVAFKNYELIQQNLNGTSGPNGYNGILSYALYWILSVRDYYDYTGDNATVIAYTNDIAGKLNYSVSVFGKNPSLAFIGSDDRVGADFEDPSRPESQRTYSTLTIQAIKSFVYMLEQTKQSSLASYYNSIAQNLTDQIKKDPQWYQVFGLHSGAGAINANITTSAENDMIFSLFMNDSVNICSYSLFNMYFILQALGKTGNMDMAYFALNRCWGGMINLGATTLWEVYSPEWNSFLAPNDPVPNCQTGYTSKCHPWASGALKWISENILGITPVKPGFSLFQIKPWLDYKNLFSVSGEVPTPAGHIQFQLDCRQGSGFLSFPEGTTAILAVPKCKLHQPSVQLNGVTIWSSISKGKPSSLQVFEDNEYVYVNNLHAGKYEITISGLSVPNEKIFTTLSSVNAFPLNYKAQFLGFDYTTKGTWTNQYGTSGYYIFAQTPKSALPPYVSSINVNAHQSFQWSTNTNDIRALSNPLNNQRSISAIATYNPYACLQTMTVDIILQNNYSTPYQISLYFVDWDTSERRQMIEMRDHYSRDTIAPTQLISSFTGGVYLKYKYNGSVRFRINHIRGADAVLSAIFFD
jgi:hypothetical protein